MFRIEFLLFSLFGIKNLIFYIILRLVELYVLYKLNEKYHFLFKKQIIISKFFETFFLLFFILFLFYFTLIYFQYYIFTLPLLYFTFIMTSDEKKNFYQKILKYLNKYLNPNNNPYCVFIEEQLEFLYYILMFGFSLLYLGDLCYLENIEVFMILGFNF